MKTITVLNAKGKRREIEVASIEVPLEDGRLLRLAFPPGDMGDLVAEAHCESGTPVILMQPGAANLATLHVLAVGEPEPDFELELAVQKALKKGKHRVPSRTQLKRWVKAAQEQDAEIALRFVDEDEGQQLNLAYRGKDYATNVLSFPYTSEPVLTGDLVLCWPVVVREAEEQGKSLEAHCAHLVVHGTLHLQGWDHEDEAEGDAMEAREREILAGLGYADPYEGER